MPYDPCSCLGNTTTSTPTSTSDCLTLGNIIISQCDSAAPCGASGSITFDCFDYNCETTPTFVVYSNSRPDLITVTDITADGLDFTTSMTAVGGERVEIVFYATCGDSCSGSSAYGSLVLYIKNLCKGVACGAGYTCAPCTGLCVPTDPEIQIINSPEIMVS